MKESYHTYCPRCGARLDVNPKPYFEKDGAGVASDVTCLHCQQAWHVEFEPDDEYGIYSIELLNNQPQTAHGQEGE